MGERTVRCWHHSLTSWCSISADTTSTLPSCGSHQSTATGTGGFVVLYGCTLPHIAHLDRIAKPQRLLTLLQVCKVLKHGYHAAALVQQEATPTYHVRRQCIHLSVHRFPPPTSQPQGPSCGRKMTVTWRRGAIPTCCAPLLLHARATQARPALNSSNQRHTNINCTGTYLSYFLRRVPPLCRINELEQLHARSCAT